MRVTPWLDPIPAGLRATARERFDAGDWRGFLSLAPNTQAILLVALNADALRARGTYEAALLDALTASRTNNAEWPTRVLRALVALADRARLRAASDPLPGPGPFTVYRGVAGLVGLGQQRRVRGLSWTFSLPLAAWFALRYALPDPAVYRLTVHEASVLAYANRSFRREEEVLVLCDGPHNPRRCLVGAELERAAEEHRLAEEERRLAEEHAALDKLDAEVLDFR